MVPMTLLIGLIKNLPTVVAAAPEFKALFDQMILAFKPHEQTRLKQAYQEARAKSDSAEDDFVEAGRGR